MTKTIETIAYILIDNTLDKSIFDLKNYPLSGDVEIENRNTDTDPKVHIYMVDRRVDSVEPLPPSEIERYFIQEIQKEPVRIVITPNGKNDFTIELFSNKNNEKPKALLTITQGKSNPNKTTIWDLVIKQSNTYYEFCLEPADL